MTLKATGSFEVKMEPLGTLDGSAGVAAVAAPGASTARMSLDKTFAGDLVGTGKGEMLTAVSDIKGSAAYVAIERVTGTLHGRAGSFVLQHAATMDRGVPSMAIRVVPDSGTGALLGLRGTFLIKITPGKHDYEFDYALPVAGAP